MTEHMVRMKHKDPNASTSLAEKDESGAIMVPHNHLEHAKAGGWYVCWDDAAEEADTGVSEEVVGSDHDDIDTIKTDESPNTGDASGNSAPRGRGRSRRG